jgi:hypothetical protein
MSLLRDIQGAATDPNIDVATLLRKAKILASRLKNQELARWVDSELDGYPDAKDLPPYRILAVSSRGTLINRWRTVHLPEAGVMSSLIPAEFRGWAETAYLIASVSAYDSLIKQSDSGGMLAVDWPQEIAVKFGAVGYAQLECLAAWQVIPVSALVAVIETVRNRVLSFALEIEEEAPDAGEAPPGAMPMPQDRVGQVFHTVIMGGVNNVAPGAVNLSQSHTVQQGDVSSLIGYLKSLGVGLSEIHSLEKILHEPLDAQRGGPVREWFGTLAMKTAEGLPAAILDLAVKAVRSCLGPAGLA